MVFNATFNNISVILWRVLLVEETGVPEKTTDLTSHRQTRLMGGSLNNPKYVYNVMYFHSLYHCAYNPYGFKV